MSEPFDRLEEMISQAKQICVQQGFVDEDGGPDGDTVMELVERAVALLQMRAKAEFDATLRGMVQDLLATLRPPGGMSDFIQMPPDGPIEPPTA